MRVTDCAADALEVLVPVALLCQYQVIPVGVLPFVRIVLLQFSVIVGKEGVAGAMLIIIIYRTGSTPTTCTIISSS